MMNGQTIFKGFIALTVLGFFLYVGSCAGAREHAEDVALRMSQETYDEIANTLHTDDVVTITKYYESRNK